VNARTTAPKALALALGALAGACSDPRGGPSSFDLFARAPDARLEQRGRLAAGAAGEPFEGLGLDGWSAEPARVDGEPVAWSLTPTAALRLPALDPRDRSLELRACVEPAPAPARVEVRLNGTALGTLELGAGLADAVLDAPAAAWVRGENLLELELDGLRPAAGGEGADAWHGVGLARVAYDDPVRIELARDGALLAAGTGLAYRLETTGGARVELAGQARGAGRLELRFAGVDAETGASAPLEQHVLELAAGQRFRTARALPEWSGAGPTELELAWRAEGEQGAGDAGARLALERLRVEEAAPAPRAPIVFVSADTFAARNASLYGYPRATTPVLDDLARESVVFRRCRANAPWTIPSYMSQLTGLYPRAHRLPEVEGLERPPTPWEQEQLAPNRWTLAEALRAAGYRTAAFVDNPLLAQGFGFAQGFDHYDTSAAEIGLEDPEGGLRHIVPRALAWLDGLAEDEPYFLFLQCFDAHAPYVPVEPWKGSFDGDGVLDPEHEVRVGRKQLFVYGLIPHHIALAHAEGDTLPERMRTAPIATAYDEKLREIDATLGELFAELERRGRFDRAWVVFSADHGESLLGHDFHFNHALLYADTLHVPLVVRPPGGVPGGRTVEGTVQLVDLYPTLLDAAGLDPRRDYLHGRSLVPALRGEELAPLPAVSEGGMHTQAAIEAEGWKLILSYPMAAWPQTRLTHPRIDRARLAELAPELVTDFFTNEELDALFEERPEVAELVRSTLAEPRIELYHLPDDPDELHDLAAEHPDLVHEALERLRAAKALAEHAQAQASFRATRVAPSAAELDELRRLGYAGD